jgi:HAD superfamily hydrolase (TIGR01509 family)
MSLPDFLPRAVICDMDGLILDTERLDGEIWRGVFAERGLDYPDAVHATVVGLHGAQTIHRLTEVYGPDVPIAALHAEVLNRWAQRLEHAPAPTRPGAVALLDFLTERRIPVAIATSTRRANVLLRLGPLVQRFAVVACGDEVAARKPAPDVYRLALERLGMAADGCLALEDSEPGVRAAEAAGLPVVSVPDIVDPPARPYRAASLHDVLTALQGCA